MHVIVWISAHHKCSLCTSEQRLDSRLCACCRQPKCSQCKAPTQHTYSAQHMLHKRLTWCAAPATTHAGMQQTHKKECPTPQQQQKQRSSCSCTFYSTSCRPRLNPCLQHPAPSRTPQKTASTHDTAANKLHPASKQRICWAPAALATLIAATARQQGPQHSRTHNHTARRPQGLIGSMILAGFRRSRFTMCC